MSARVLTAIDRLAASTPTRILDPRDPIKIARELVGENFTAENMQTLHHQGLSQSSGVHGSLGIAADFAASDVGGGP
jgi:hypothetical protein